MSKDQNQKNNDDLATVQAQSAEYLAGWQRAKADYENFKKETDRRMTEISSFAKIGVISELLPLIDNFTKAIDHVPADQQSAGWVVGVFHIKKQLEDFLAANGWEKIPTIGHKFDHNLHEAVGNEPGEKDLIIKEVGAGYRVKGQVVMPAKVIVGE